MNQWVRKAARPLGRVVLAQRLMGHHLDPAGKHQVHVTGQNCLGGEMYRLLP